METRLKPTWDWMLTVMDATEAQLRFGASLTHSTDPSHPLHPLHPLNPQPSTSSINNLSVPPSGKEIRFPILDYQNFKFPLSVCIISQLSATSNSDIGNAKHIQHEHSHRWILYSGRQSAQFRQRRRCTDRSSRIFDLCVIIDAIA